MNNKIIAISLAVLAVLVIGGVYIYNTANTPGTQSNYSDNGSSNNSGNKNTTQTQGKGTFYVTVTDATGPIENVSAVNMTIDNVKVHSATQGWVTVSQGAQTFSLLELKAKNQAKLAGNVDIATGIYDQIQLHVAKVMVTQSGKVVEAKPVSSDILINYNMAVNGNTNAVARVDIMADKSLHISDNGEFIFAPVVKFENSNDSTVTVDSDNIVVVSGGKINPSINFGMNLDGQMKQDFILSASVNLKINGLNIEAK